MRRRRFGEFALKPLRTAHTRLRCAMGWPLPLAQPWNSMKFMMSRVYEMLETFPSCQHLTSRLETHLNPILPSGGIESHLCTKTFQCYFYHVMSATARNL